MKINRETAQILSEIANSNNGLNRFIVNPSSLNGPAFAMTLKSLAYFENQLDGNLDDLTTQRHAKGNKLDPELIVFYGQNLVEIKFCMGLFSIAFSDPKNFDFTEDTTAWDIYLELEAKKESLPPKAREKFNIASASMHRGDVFKKIGNTLKSANHAFTSGCMWAGHKISDAIEATPDVLNRFAKWLDKKTTDNKNTADKAAK
jgi:hypothetical protein